MTTTPAVEAVARAICNNQHPIWMDDEDDPPTWEELHATEWVDEGYEYLVPPKEYYYPSATAAIAAYEAATPIVEEFEEELKSAYWAAVGQGRSLQPDKD